MKLVIIESPYRGRVEHNKAYAHACLLDSLERGEAPLASHLLYTKVLDDNDYEERQQGMSAGWAWAAKADLIAVYQDLGISQGMLEGIEANHGKPIEYRSIAGWG